MTSDMLSQDEIDALLKQGGGEEEDASSSEHNIEDFISPLEQDALGEIGNITFGSASTALSTLLGQKVDITTPKISLLMRDAVQDSFPNPHVAVHVKYTEGFQGINLLVIKEIDAKIIADLMMGGDGTNPSGELNELHVSAVQEAMNQMMVQQPPPCQPFLAVRLIFLHLELTLWMYRMKDLLNSLLKMKCSSKCHLE